MSRAGMTSLPCPTCKSSARLRPKDELCYECQRIYQDGKLYRERLAASPEKVARVVPSSYDARFYVGNGTKQETDATVRRLFDLMFELAIAVSEPNLEGNYYDQLLFQIGQKTSPHGMRVTLDKAMAERLEELYSCIKNGLRGAYLDGERRGLSILTQLSEGQLTVNEFDHTEGADRK